MHVLINAIDESLLTHFTVALKKEYLGKQCRPRSDVAERDVWSGSAQFAYRNFYSKYNKNETVKSSPISISKGGQVHWVYMGYVSQFCM